LPDTVPLPGFFSYPPAASLHPIAAMDTTVMHDMSEIKEKNEIKGITVSVTATSTIATAGISFTRKTFR
jgi:hypothetical protein